MDSRPKRPVLRIWTAQASAQQEWKDLRRDPELWFRGGNVLVHVRSRNQHPLARQGPAFKLPFAPLLAAGAHPLLDRCVSFEGYLAQGAGPGILPGQSWEDWWALQNPSRRIELYLPASFPDLSSSQSAASIWPNSPSGSAEDLDDQVLYRNFFAFIFGRALVGTSLSAAVLCLLHSISAFRLPNTDATSDLLRYLHAAGYLNFHDEPAHALAALRLAEAIKLRPLYVDAFAHCVAMAHPGAGLFSCPDFELLSATSRRLIRHARVRTDLNLSCASIMLRDFLGEDLSASHLGLDISARAHLDRFRSFLLAFYSARFGYYPPISVDPRLVAFHPTVYRRLRADFEALYTLLVDPVFTLAESIPPLAQGGICVVQSVHSFDLRHNYNSLRHPLPKLPNVASGPSSPTASSFSISSGTGFCATPSSSNCSSNSSLFSSPSSASPSSLSRWSSRRPGSPFLPFRAQQNKLRPDKRLVAHASLARATNQVDPEITANDLVRAYLQFEADSVLSPLYVDRHSRLTVVDARKVRWILIYAVYQVLRNVTEPPSEIRNPDDAPYLLAISTDGLPPWSELSSQRPPQLPGSFRSTAASTLPSDGQACLPASPKADIRPDIDHLAHTQQRDLDRPFTAVGIDHEGTACNDGATVATRNAPTRSHSLGPFTSLRRSLIRFRSSSTRQTAEHRRTKSPAQASITRPMTSSAATLRNHSSRRATFHEILVQGYGNGTNEVLIEPSHNTSYQRPRSFSSTLSASGAYAPSATSPTTSASPSDCPTDPTSACSSSNSPKGEEADHWCSTIALRSKSRRQSLPTPSLQQYNERGRYYRPLSAGPDLLTAPWQVRRASAVDTDWRRLVDRFAP